MVTKKPKGLGRGLEALLGPKVDETAAEAGSTGGANAGQPASLRLSDMVPGMYQPRTRMDEGALYELAESIKAQGIMQPILVRKLSDGPNAGKYEIIAGERRFRASRLAGLDSVPVLVRDVPNEAAAAMALIENIQREDLNPLEEAGPCPRPAGAGPCGPDHRRQPDQRQEDVGARGGKPGQETRCGVCTHPAKAEKGKIA